MGAEPLLAPGLVVARHVAGARSPHEGNSRERDCGFTLVALDGHQTRRIAQCARLQRLRAGVHHRLSLRDVLQSRCVGAVLVSRFGAAVCAAVYATRWWWLLLLAVCPFACSSMYLPTIPGVVPGLVYLNDCAKAVLAALLLKRFLADPIRLTSMRDLGFYLPVRRGARTPAQRLCWCGRAQRARESLLGELSNNGSSAMPWRA